MSMQMTSLLSLNPIHLLFFIFFTKSSYSSSSSSSSSSYSSSSSSSSNSSINFCPEIERHSLLTFKQSLEGSENFLSSWDGEEMNCCKWEGVVCNNSTGHVSHLHLHSDDYNLGGKINPSLTNLKHLTYLDLSSGFFTAETIPSFIGSLSSLEYLNLSYSQFSGKIPPTIGNLSNLHTLDLASGIKYNLESENLEWLAGLSRLEYLNLNDADLQMVKNWAKVINSLPCLLELHLSSCSLDISQHVANLSTSLTLIDVSHNGNRYHDESDQSFFPLPQWFFQLENLVYLDLSFNSYPGPIPTLSNATKLRFLDFSYNHLNSSIPDWVYSCKDLKFLRFRDNSIQGEISESIGNLTSLETLDLSKNHLSGKLPTQISSFLRLRKLDLSKNELEGDLQDSFGNMSHCFLGSLQFLRLSHNRLSGHLTEQFGEFRVLESLYLRNNSLSGTLPISLGNSSSLQILLLDHNRFTGNLPVSLGQLSKLIEFDVDNNQLEGITGLSNLAVFSASGNHLTLSVGPNWIPPKNTTDLGLGSWSLGGGSSQIPSWLQRRIDNIENLDLSNTGISGTPPSWFFDTSFLNVSSNNLHGKIPYLNKKFASTYLMSYNNFSGSLPQIGDEVFHLDLSHNTFSEGLSDFLCNSTFETDPSLSTLNLEGNRLSGELPDCWEKWPDLRYLNLGNNSISGHLPNSLGFLVWLESLNLYGNKFSGQIPFSMSNITNLLKMDLGRNHFNGNVPKWIGTSLVRLEILILRSNNFSSEIPWELCHLEHLHILDLSNNEISGVIPKCLHNLTAMATKRVLLYAEDMEYDYTGHTYTETESATVATKGLELEYSTILSLVTNIDLSSNHLRGEIPKELTSLVELRSLNLSRNRLSGSIPNSIGQMKQLESLDLSTNTLSGQIPIGFTRLSSLSFLNLSFNNLSGRIPQGTQLQSMDASRYIGNDLCGLPLARNCINSDGEDEVHGHEGEEGKGKIEWMYVFLSAGYAVGFSGICSVLVLKKRWRESYFGLLERIWDELYVYFHVWIQKF